MLSHYHTLAISAIFRTVYWRGFCLLPALTLSSFLCLGNRPGNGCGNHIMQKKSAEDFGLQPMSAKVRIHSVWGQNGKTYCLGMDAKVYYWQRSFRCWVLDTHRQPNNANFSWKDTGFGFIIGAFFASATVIALTVPAAAFFASAVSVGLGLGLMVVIMMKLSQ